MITASESLCHDVVRPDSPKEFYSSPVCGLTVDHCDRTLLLHMPGWGTMPAMRIKEGGSYGVNWTGGGLELEKLGALVQSAAELYRLADLLFGDRRQEILADLGFEPASQS